MRVLLPILLGCPNLNLAIFCSILTGKGFGIWNIHHRYQDVKSSTYRCLALQESSLGLVGLVTATGWVSKLRLQLVSVWLHAWWSKQIHPWDIQACCWDVQQPTNNKTAQGQFSAFEAVAHSVSTASRSLVHPQHGCTPVSLCAAGNFPMLNIQQHTSSMAAHQSVSVLLLTSPCWTTCSNTHPAWLHTSQSLCCCELPHVEHTTTHTQHGHTPVSLCC